jgi:hypothetical protein
MDAVRGLFHGLDYSGYRDNALKRLPPAANHVVNVWIGHSAKVVEKSYLQVTPDHWKAGAKKIAGDQNGGAISANRGLSDRPTEPKKKPLQR